MYYKSLAISCDKIGKKRYHTRCIQRRTYKVPSKLPGTQYKNRDIKNKEPCTCTKGYDSVKYNSYTGKSAGSNIIRITKDGRTDAVEKGSDRDQQITF